MRGLSGACEGEGAAEGWVLSVYDQVEGAVGIVAIGVVGVDPHALVLLSTAEAAAQRDADLTGGLGGDARPADARDVDTVAHVAGEDDLVLARSEMSHPRHIPPAHERAVRFDDGPERAVAASLHAILGRVVGQFQVIRPCLFHSFGGGGIVCARHLKSFLCPAWIPRPLSTPLLGLLLVTDSAPPPPAPPLHRSHVTCTGVRRGRRRRSSRTPAGRACRTRARRAAGRRRRREWPGPGPAQAGLPLLPGRSRRCATCERRSGRPPPAW